MKLLEVRTDIPVVFDPASAPSAHPKIPLIRKYYHMFIMFYSAAKTPRTENLQYLKINISTASKANLSILDNVGADTVGVVVHFLLKIKSSGPNRCLLCIL